MVMGATPECAATPGGERREARGGCSDGTFLREAERHEY